MSESRLQPLSDRAAVFALTRVVSAQSQDSLGSTAPLHVTRILVGRGDGLYPTEESKQASPNPFPLASVFLEASLLLPAPPSRPLRGGQTSEIPALSLASTLGFLQLYRSVAK